MRDIFGPPKTPRSVSQINQYNRCPYSYYLARIKMVWQRPAAWLPQGTAVHETAEWWERERRLPDVEEMVEYYNKVYDAEVNRYLKITPNPDFWSASGQYRGQRDILRRFAKGQDQVRAYHRYYTETAPREVIWIAPAVADDRCSGIVEGGHVAGCACRPATPGIELGFDFDLDGVRVRGFIDAMIERPLDIPLHTPEGLVTHELLVRDNKTGNNPGDDFQLAVYGVAIQDSYGVEPLVGDYWMGRAGKPTAPFDLTRWPRSRVADSFAELEARIDAGDFPATPDPDKCKFCDVSAACEYRA